MEEIVKTRLKSLWTEAFRVRVEVSSPCAQSHYYNIIQLDDMQDPSPIFFLFLNTVESLSLEGCAGMDIGDIWLRIS